MNAPRVFISHTTSDHRDSALAHEIAKGIRHHGGQVWIAPDSIPGGIDWEQEIVLAVMRKCTHFLVIVSAAAALSKWVQREIELAQTRFESDASFSILPLVVGAVGNFPGSDFLNRFQQLPYQPEASAQLAALMQVLGLRHAFLDLTVQLADARFLVKNLGVRPLRPTFSIGDELCFSFRASRDCHLSLLNIGPTGAPAILLPNELQQSNELKSGRWYKFPSPDDCFTLPVLGPPGTDKVIGIASSMRLSLNLANVGDQVGESSDPEILVKHLCDDHARYVLAISVIEFGVIAPNSPG